MNRIEGFIDHFEEQEAVISTSDRSSTRVSREDLPLNAHIGDFIIEINHHKHFIIDRKITALRLRDIRRMCDYCL